jgi:hypothetical protein
MGFVLCAAGFISVWLTARRSLGHGLGLLLAIGSVYGIVRANVFDGFVHFLFDASVLGLYLGCGRRVLEEARTQVPRARSWIGALCVLPFLLILLSPLVDAQPLIIQILGLRTAMFFVPLLLVGAVVARTELEALGTWAALVVLVAAVFAFGEFVWGLEPFLPLNSATEIIYISKDVTGTTFHRIPSTFVSSHGYGGTMVALLPLLFLKLERGGKWLQLGTFCILIAALGVFVSGARSPVLVLAFVALALAGSKSTGRRTRVVLALVGIALVVIVPLQSRLQRFETLQDPEFVEGRVRTSVNVGFLEAVSEHPFGRGLGSAAGTSIPYFLSDIARPQYGIENEYARIVLEEGLPGLLLWVVLLAWVLVLDPRRLGAPFERGAWAVCISGWVQAFIGTGVLSSIPGTLILLTYMGVLARRRETQVHPAPAWVPAVGVRSNP